MIKKLIISDTNIIVFLGVGEVFEKFCLNFNVCITEDVAEEINNGRAAKTDAKEMFYRQYSQGRIQILVLSNGQEQMRDELMQRKTKIGKGESSCIASAYESEQSIFATNDRRAIEIACDILGEDRVISCEEILDAMIAKDLLNDQELLAVRGLMDS